MTRAGRSGSGVGGAMLEHSKKRADARVGRVWDQLLECVRLDPTHEALAAAIRDRQSEDAAFNQRLVSLGRIITAEVPLKHREDIDSDPRLKALAEEAVRQLRRRDEK